MPYYETVFIARQDLSEAQVKELTEAYSKIIKDAKGKILKVENWGLRTLAYKISKNRRGHYVLIESDSEPAPVIEMERQMRLSEDILRYMTIKLKAPSKGPSAIIDKSGRDTRDNKETYEKDAA
ncbi:MAG: 30S ribosomal protein S6 [Alphaproteobacteria bacterium]|nr:30S ribosomal protein S6 [Alphaproteobacteria bacterium]NCQ88971.1 30S ribosomal protein S6 [Alphaproteobacteria bacterium]NCT07872.1 30S ribosomal protein S6 [Alphaproteobacteria bacterium]